MNDSSSKQTTSTHAAGVSLVVLSAVVFSTAGLFSKGLAVASWDIIFWRGVFAAAFTTVYVIWRGKFRAEFVAMGKSGVAAALLGASGTAAFVPAFKFTSIANVSLIYAATPVLAMLLAWIWIGERITKYMVVSAMASLGGVLLIVSGSLGKINLTGDLLALWMAVAIAILLVVYRVFPATPAAGPAVLSSLVLFPIALFVGEPLQNSLHDIGVMALFGLTFALASVTLAEGARRLPAGETALLSLLEMPLAPILALLVFHEWPELTTMFGGAMILIGVLYSQRGSSVR